MVRHHQEGARGLFQRRLAVSVEAPPVPGAQSCSMRSCVSLLWRDRCLSFETYRLGSVAADVPACGIELSDSSTAHRQPCRRGSLKIARPVHRTTAVISECWRISPSANGQAIHLGTSRLALELDRDSGSSAPTHRCASFEGIDSSHTLAAEWNCDFEPRLGRR